MSDGKHLYSRIEQIFITKLNIEVPSADTDIIENAILDSLSFVDLLLYLEQEFGRQISLDDLDVHNFRSIAKIAEFLSRMDGSAHTATE